MRLLLGLAFALVLLVVVCSATLRLATSGVGCSPWPACRAQVAAAAAGDAVPEWQQALRLTHRVSATAAGLVFVFIVAFGFAGWSPSQRVAGASLLVLAAVLAGVGRITPSPQTGVVLANLLGGHLLLAALAWLLGAASPRPAPARWPGWPPCAAVLLLSLSGGIAGVHGGLWLHVALGVLVAVALAVTAWRCRHSGAAVARLAALCALLAAATALLGLPPAQPALRLPAAVAHSVLAGLTLAGCAAWWATLRAASRPRRGAATRANQRPC